MSGKMRLIITVGLALVSFGGALLLSMLLGGPPQGPERADRPEAPVAAPAGMSLGMLDKMTPKEEKLNELVRQLNGQIEEYRRKARELELLEKRLDVSRELLKREAQQLEDLRLQLVKPLTELQEAKAELERTRITIQRQEEARLKRLAAVYEKLDADAGARIMESMCKNEQEDDVVKILYVMSERAAAKVLGKIGETNAELGARLVSKVKRIRQEG